MTARVLGVTSRTGHSGYMVARLRREHNASGSRAPIRGTLWERAHKRHYRDTPKARAVRDAREAREAVAAK